MGKRKMSPEQNKAAKKRKKRDRKIVAKVVEHLQSVSDPVVVEVGAYVGDFIGRVYEASPSAKVSGIEPLESNISQLKTNFPDKDLHIFQGIASGKEEAVELFLSDLCSASKRKNMDCSAFKESAEKNNAQIKSSVTVAGKPLSRIISEDFLLDHVDVLSMNCEGGEYSVFDGDDFDFLEKTDMFYIHMHTKCELFMGTDFVQKRENIVKTLEENGFAMIEGMTDLKALAHVVQLWKKNTI